MDHSSNIHPNEVDPGVNTQPEEKFVIKNLDTGLRMRIDDFERLTTPSAEEVEVETPSKKGSLLKGTAKIKSWTQKATAKAKQAVSGIKDKANELGQELEKRHQTAVKPMQPRQYMARMGSLDGSIRSSLDAAVAAGLPQVHMSAPHRMEEPLRQRESDVSRRTSSLSSVDGGDAGYLDMPLALSKQPPSALQTAAAASAAAAAAIASAASSALVPAKARIMQHKRSGNGMAEARMVQQLAGHEGAVWALEFSPDGQYLATAGQDCFVRVWEVTAARTAADDSDGRPSCSDSPSDGQAPQPQLQRSSASTDAQYMQGREEQGQQQDSDLIPYQRPSTPPEPNTASTSDPDQPQQQQQAARHQQGLAAAQTYLHGAPLWQYAGHTEDILDLCWSPGSCFLLSCSLDKSCRLWHVSQGDCLRTFWHSDFVTSVKFHPTDVQKFVTGSIDGKIRLWSITQTRVLALANLHQDMVTALAFSTDGVRLVAGTMRGKCRFYNYHDTSGDGALEYVTQVDVRNARGQHSSGKKITGIAPMPGNPSQFLVTSNDSRLRLYDGYSLITKFKGHRNSSTQIRGALSPAGGAVACGSDNGWVHLWAAVPALDTAAGRNGKNPACEAFLVAGGGAAGMEGATSAVLGVAFAPACLKAASSSGMTGAAEADEAAGESMELALATVKQGPVLDAAAAAAAPAAAAAGAVQHVLRHVVVTAGLGGEVKVWELWGAPLQEN